MRISCGFKSSFTISTIRRPESWLAFSKRLSAAGVPAKPGKVIPSASATQPIVDAVPIVLQWPLLRIIELSDSLKSASLIFPERTSAAKRQTSVPHPNCLPLNVPLSIGPPGTTMAGRFTDVAPIRSDGIVLSQPPRRTTPSIGLPRIISSTAIAAKFRHSIAVGRKFDSPSESIGRLCGTPPASQIPFFTLWAISSRCILHGVRSDAVLRIAICGRVPVKAESGLPRRIHAR